MKADKSYNSPNAWEPLANALRDELQECGWLLSLLTQQQRGILDRDSTQILESNVAIEPQARLIADLKHKRQELVKACLVAMDLDDTMDISTLVSFMPLALQAMFEALIKEIRSLLRRIRRRVVQNEKLLSRAVELNETLLDTLRPHSAGRVYGHRGNLYRKGAIRGSVMETAV